jgi:hypothetical protein
VCYYYLINHYYNLLIVSFVILPYYFIVFAVSLIGHLAINAAHENKELNYTSALSLNYTSAASLNYTSAASLNLLFLNINGKCSNYKCLIVPRCL